MDIEQEFEKYFKTPLCKQAKEFTACVIIANGC